MERLTKVDGIGQNEIIKCFGCDLERAGAELEHCGYCEHWQAVVDRLAAYEDTGLEPEDIVKMGMAYEDSKRYSGRLEGKLNAYRALGTTEELSALVKARDEGLLVVLPCKAGDVVYALGYQSIRELTICSCARIGYCAEDENGKLDYLGYDVFGKTVFLTRAEAEEALQKGAPHETDPV